MKKNVYETDKIEKLIPVKKALDEAHIDYEVKTKVSNIHRNFLNLFLYHVMSTGTRRENEVMGIYVEEGLVEKARSVVQKCEKEKGWV